MNLNEALTRATTSVRKLKEDHVRRVRGAVGQTDIHTMVECYRGNDLVASVFMPPDRDLMLRAAFLAANTLSADLIAVSMETWSRPDDATHPITGEPIGQGDLEDLAKNHRGLERGWVVEGIVTQVLNRAGDSDTVMQTYRIAGQDVEWLETQSQDGGWSFQGLVPDSLAEAMQHESFDQAVGRAGVTYAGEHARTMTDIAAVNLLYRHLGENVLVALAADRGSERAQIIHDWYENGPDADSR